MSASAVLGYQRMDLLCRRQEPFVCLIDFLQQEVLVFKLSELPYAGLYLDFPDFSFKGNFAASKETLHLTAQPPTMEAYAKGFHTVQEHLRSGNSYLLNYTCRTSLQINYSLAEIFQASVAKYKVLYQDAFTCFSPETFIRIKKGRIFTHPMKGTIDADLPGAAEQLRSSVKEKAEHYTVVDLLRNDLSMIADGVTVDKFQRIDLLRTAQRNLFAMSSEISGTVKPFYQNRIGSLLQKILPAGSILGAPKKKTLGIILEAEDFPRNFYTGICGYFDGENFDSCVLIRFIEKIDGKYYYKSGGGITHLSILEEEYAEMINKIYVPVH